MIIEIIIEFNVHFDFTFHACNFIVKSFLIFDMEGKRDVQSFITTLYRNFDPLLFRVSKVIREHHHRNYHRIQRSFYVPRVCFESSSLFLFTEEKRDVWSLLFLCSSPIFDPLTYRPFVSKVVREIVIEIIIFDFTFHARVSNSRTFFVFTGHGRKEEPCLLSTVTQRTLKKKKEKKTTRTSRKCFVSRREWNSIDSIITYRSYSITRHSAKRTPINRSSIFISLFFLLFLISLPLPSNYLLYRKKKVLYTRSTREDIIKHEEGSPSNEEKSIPILGVQIKSCSKRSRSPRRSLKSSSEIRSSPPFPLASGFVRCRARASKLICRDERQQKR